MRQTIRAESAGITARIQAASTAASLADTSVDGRYGSCTSKRSAPVSFSCPSAGPANPAAGEQNHAVTNPLRVDQLMNSENESPAARGLVANYAHNVPCLPKIKTVEWLIHEQDGMRRQQGQRQQEATGISFR